MAGGDAGDDVERHGGAADGQHLLDHGVGGVRVAGDQPDDDAAVLGGGDGGLGHLGRLAGGGRQLGRGCASRTASWTATETSGSTRTTAGLGERRGRRGRSACRGRPGLRRRRRPGRPCRRSCGCASSRAPDPGPEGLSVCGWSAGRRSVMADRHELGRAAVEQFGGERAAEGGGVGERSGDRAADGVAAVDRGHRGAEEQLGAVLALGDLGVGGDRRAAAGLERGEQCCARRRRRPGRRRRRAGRAARGCGRRWCGTRRRARPARARAAPAAGRGSR